MLSVLRLKSLDESMDVYLKKQQSRTKCMRQLLKPLREAHCLSLAWHLPRYVTDWIMHNCDHWQGMCVCVFTLQVFGQFCYLGTLCPFVREKEMCMYARERDLIIQQSYNWLSLTSENQLWITLSAQNVQHQYVCAMDWKTLNLKSNPIKGRVQENGKSLLLILMSFQTNIIWFFHGTHTKMFLYIIVCVFHWKNDSMYRFGMTCWLNNEVFHQKPNSPVWRKNKKQAPL